MPSFSFNFLKLAYVLVPPVLPKLSLYVISVPLERDMSLDWKKSSFMVTTGAIIESYLRSVGTIMSIVGFLVSTIKDNSLVYAVFPALSVAVILI